MMKPKRNLVKSSKRTKVPPKLPTWVCKAMWNATALKLKVPARSSEEAWDVAWRKVAKMEGGDSCLGVTVIGRIT